MGKAITQRIQVAHLLRSAREEAQQMLKPYIVLSSEHRLCHLLTGAIPHSDRHAEKRRI